MARIDFSSLQSAIQQAFDTYWRVREGRQGREENEKERQAAMQRMQVQLAGGMAQQRLGEKGATERAQLGATVEREQLGETIRHNREQEKIMWANIDAKIKEGKRTEAVTMMVAAAEQAQKIAELAQKAYDAQDWAALEAMPEFSARDVKSLQR